MALDSDIALTFDDLDALEQIVTLAASAHDDELPALLSPASSATSSLEESGYESSIGSPTTDTTAAAEMLAQDISLVGPISDMFPESDLFPDLI